MLAAPGITMMVLLVARSTTLLRTERLFVGLKFCKNIHCAQGMDPKDFRDSFTLPPAPLAAQSFSFIK